MNHRKLKTHTYIANLSDKLDTLNITTFDIEKMINEHGFFYYPISNKNKVLEMLNKVKIFFAQSKEIKLSQPHNNLGLGYIPMNRSSRGYIVTKESYTYIPNKIKLPIDFEDIFTEYYNYCNSTARIIFIQLMDILKITNKDYDKIINHTTGTMSILHYPQVEMKDKMVGILPHCDWGLITILYTDTDGLQVQINNKWYNIPHKEGYFIVNIADMLEVLSNGKYKSTLHRVINIDEKYSIAFFYDPSPQTIIKPFECKYLPVKYGDYHGNKINASYRKPSD